MCCRNNKKYPENLTNVLSQHDDMILSLTIRKRSLEVDSSVFPSSFYTWPWTLPSSHVFQSQLISRTEPSDGRKLYAEHHVILRRVLKWQPVESLTQQTFHTSTTWNGTAIVEPCVREVRENRRWRCIAWEISMIRSAFKYLSCWLSNDDLINNCRASEQNTQQI